MLDLLKETIENSYSPISNEKVVAIVKMKDGEIFKGVNVENPSFKSGLCAEQVAIGQAITAGYKKGDFESIYIMDDSNNFIYPCFLCRQNFVDFFTDTKIYLVKNEKEIKEYTLDELCPHTFRMEGNDE